MTAGVAPGGHSLVVEFVGGDEFFARMRRLIADAAAAVPDALRVQLLGDALRDRLTVEVAR